MADFNPSFSFDFGQEDASFHQAPWDFRGMMSNMDEYRWLQCHALALLFKYRMHYACELRSIYAQHISISYIHHMAPMIADTIHRSYYTSIKHLCPQVHWSTLNSLQEPP